MLTDMKEQHAPIQEDVGLPIYTRDDAQFMESEVNPWAEMNWQS
jgi:hypothetical protein